MIKAIVLGASYGGMEAIKTIFSELPDAMRIPFLVVLHIGTNKIDTFLVTLNQITPYCVKEAEEKEIIKPGTVFFAPPDYHLQVETPTSLSLSTDEKVNFSRPSIDVLFETAAWVYKHELLGVLLTGSNSDGAKGLKTIQKFGGLTLVEDPETAFAKIMPLAAINLSEPDFILPVKDIAGKIAELTSKPHK